MPAVGKKRVERVVDRDESPLARPFMASDKVLEHVLAFTVILAVGAGWMVAHRRTGRATADLGADETQAAMAEPPRGGAATPTGPATETAPPSNEEAAPWVASDIKKGIRRVGANRYDVDRAVIALLEKAVNLSRCAPIYPEQEDGRVVGVRLFGVGPDTWLAALGIENGDRVEKVDGLDMTSPENALDAYLRLRTAAHVTVSVNRRGHATNLDYTIK